jgi:hypothetical protein
MSKILLTLFFTGELIWRGGGEMREAEESYLVFILVLPQGV